MARRPIEGIISEKRLMSEELGEEIPLLIYTPPNFTPLKSYDVLICQDGNDYFQIGRIPRVVEELMNEMDIRELIVVGVPYPSVKERRKRYHPEGEKTPAYIRFLVHELLPYIDEHYPTHQLASSRTLAGDSLAATVSLMTALSYPHIFGQVMMHSPYVDQHVLQAVSACTHPEELSLYHVIGIHETAVDTTDGKTLDFVEPNREMNRLIKSLPFTYTYYEFNGDHTWKHWQKDLERGLTTLIPF